ncbi:hypothetical protein BDQ17DRAFT_1239291, partial [Cyathus striatus]
ITQLVTEHIALNKHLHRIGKVASPMCTKCNMNFPESVDHFLLQCLAFANQRFPLFTQCANQQQNISLHIILTNPENYSVLAGYVNATSHLKQTLGTILFWRPIR